MKQMRYKMIAVLFLFFGILPIQPATADLVIVGEAIAVINGDTMKVLWTGGIEMIRLTDIDCPDRKQAYGEAAKIFTEDLTIARTVIITIKDVDPFGRSVGEVFLENGKSLNKELLKAGLAWWRKEHLEEAAFSTLEKEAREKKVGLWQDKNPIPPWEFR